MVEPSIAESDLLAKIKQLEAENADLKNQLETFRKRNNQLTTYEYILKKSREHISILDRNYIYLAVSQRYLDAHNCSADEIVGHRVPELLGEEVFEEKVKPNLDRCLNGHTVNYQAWFDFKNFGKRYMDVNYFPILEPECQTVYHIIVSAHDLTDLYQTQTEQRLAKSFFDNTSEGIIITDPSGIIINVNPAFSRISGYSKLEVIGQNANLTKSGKHDEQFYQNMWTCIKNTGQWQGEIWDRHKNGHIYPKYLAINEVIDENDRVMNYVGIFSDITEIKDTQNQLEQLAYFDVLTRLPNRTHFFENLEHELAMAKRTQQKFALFFIDLDGFKLVNDSYGHKVGDLLLKHVAQEIKSCVRKTDFVARLGGDEFTVILLNTDNIEQIIQIAENIGQALAAQFEIAGHQISIGASIGIFRFPRDGEDIQTILSEADHAMYKAKKSGKGCYAMVEKKSKNSTLSN